jgi:hypothetical protein
LRGSDPVDLFSRTEEVWHLERLRVSTLSVCTFV